LAAGTALKSFSLLVNIAVNITLIQLDIWFKLALVISVAAAAGLTCIIAPPFLLPGGIQSTYTAPLFPTLTTAWENLAFGPTMLSLFVLGIVLGAFQPRFWWLVGAAPVAPLPVAAVLEMVVSPTSHNLWPIEFALYAFVGLSSFLGAFIGSRFTL